MIMRNSKIPAKASAETRKEEMKAGPTLLWKSDPQLHEALRSAGNVRSARSALFDLLRERESLLHARDCDVHALERSNSLHCIG